jgi:hypothetical protein
MNRKLFPTLAAGAFALLSACGSDTVETTDPMQGALKVVVTDEATGQKVSGAKATLLPSGRNATTKADGIANLGDVLEGSSRLTVEAAGYAKYESSVSISPMQENLQSVTLYKMDASYEGYAAYESENGDKAPIDAANFKVGIRFSGLANEQFPDAAIGADGKFTFASLPGGLSGAIIISGKVGDVEYFSSSSTGTLARGRPTFAPSAISLSPSALGFFQVGCAPLYVSASEPVVCTFSKDVLPSSVSNNAGRANFNAAASGNKITVTPLVPWKNLGTATVSISGIEPADRLGGTASLSASLTLAPEALTPFTAAVSGLGLGSDGVTLEWTALTAEQTAGFTGVSYATRCYHGNNQVDARGNISDFLSPGESATCFVRACAYDAKSNQSCGAWSAPVPVTYTAP